jgi:Leucine Rich repeat
VGGVVYSLGNDDPVAPTALDSLLQELKPWIAPTEDDLLHFNNTASPQSLALTWQKDDPKVMSKDRDTSVVLQRYVLAVLYYSTLGSGWDESYNFMSDADVCTWNNGTDSANGGEGVFGSTDNKTIDWVAMRDNRLRSVTLPWELFLLTSLTHIDLGWNGLKGTIPTRIGLLTKLEYLDLSSNQLTAPLPTTMPSTIQLILSFNALTGANPSSWGAGMPELQVLDLNSNQFTGPLPSTMPPTLTYLSLSFNMLTGTIPSSWGAGMPELQVLDLFGNKLTGPLPTTMPSMVMDLYLAYNMLSGTTPSSWGADMPELQRLDLGFNQLTVTIPSDLRQIMNQ